MSDKTFKDDKKLLISVQELEKRFDTLYALKRVSIDIYEGDVVFIIGLSGSGKSTFLRCLNRLEEPTGGQILFEHVDITDKKTNIKTNKKTNMKKRLKPQEKDILNYCKKPRSLVEICDNFGFKDTRTFKKNYLNDLINNGKLEMTIPNQPRNKNQKYISK